ncbi:MAG: hypothetical protein WCQ99_12435, partial [Pseudomonadota bacterium]
LMLATPDLLSIDFQSLQKKLGRQDIKENLKQVLLDSPFILLSSFTSGEEKIKAMVAEGADIITDDSPAHLFFPPGASLNEQYEKWPAANFNKLYAYQESIIPYLKNLSDSAVQREKIIDGIKSYEAKKKN